MMHFVKGVSIGGACRFPEPNHLTSKAHSYSPLSKQKSSISKSSFRPASIVRKPLKHKLDTDYQFSGFGVQKQSNEMMQNYSQCSPTTQNNLINSQIGKKKSFQSLNTIEKAAVKTDSPIKVLDSYVDPSNKTITANKQISSNKSNTHVAKKFLAILPQYAPSKLNLNNKLLNQQKEHESMQKEKDVTVEIEANKQVKNQEQQVYFVPRSKKEAGPQQSVINALKHSSDRFILNDTVTQPWLSSNQGSQNSNRSVVTSSFQNSKTNRQGRHNVSNRESFKKPQNNESSRNSLQKSKSKSRRQNASVNYYKIMSDESADSKEYIVENRQDIVVNQQMTPIEESIQINGMISKTNSESIDPYFIGADPEKGNQVHSTPEIQEPQADHEYQNDNDKITQQQQNPYNTSFNLMQFEKAGLKQGNISRIDAYSDQMLANHKKDGSKSQQDQSFSSKTFQKQAGTLKLGSEVTDYNKLSQLNFHLDYQLKQSHNSLNVSSQHNQQIIQGSRLDTSSTDLQHLFDQEEREEAIKRSSRGSGKKKGGFFQSRNLSIKQRTHLQNKEQMPLHRFTIDFLTIQNNAKKQISRNSLHQTVYQGSHSLGCKGHNNLGNHMIKNDSYKKNFTKFDCKLCYSDIFHEYHEQEAQREMANALREYALAEEQQKHYSILKRRNNDTHITSSALTVVNEQVSNISYKQTDRSNALFKLRPKAHSQATLPESLKQDNSAQNFLVKNDEIPLSIMIQAMNKSNALIDSNDLVHNLQDINQETVSFVQKAKVSTDEIEGKDLEGANH